MCCLQAGAGVPIKLIPAVFFGSGTLLSIVVKINVNVRGKSALHWYLLISSLYENRIGFFSA
jgi:hypothetical protein